MNKNVVTDMLFYYIYSLVKQGVEDPLQVLVAELPEMINISKEQLEYIKINALQKGKLVENLDSSIKLLSSIEESKTLDLESIKIVNGILEIIRNDADISLQKIFGNNEDDGDK